MNNKILILGASGLLGQALLEFFKQKNYEIGAISRNPIECIEKNITTHAVNILDGILLESIIKEYDIVLNCTGQITNPINECYLLNTKGISNIINAVKKFDKRLIHISSVSVYGSADYVNEDSDLNPETPYASMKCFSDYLIQSNLTNFTILRVSNLYGKNQKKGIMNYLTKSYLSNENNLYFNNDGNLKRYYLYIEDLAFIIQEILNKNVAGIYNIASKDQFTIRELVFKFENILNHKFYTTYANVPSNENISTINSAKLASILNQNHQVHVEQYIKGIKI